MAKCAFDGILDALTGMKGKDDVLNNVPSGTSDLNANEKGAGVPAAGGTENGQNPIAIVCSRMVIVPGTRGTNGSLPLGVGGEVESPAEDGMWDESKHPRKGGKFAPKGQGETYSKTDALALHNAMGKANWEELQAQRQLAKNPVATRTYTPMSDMQKAHTKLNTLLEVNGRVKPGASIRDSGVGYLHRQQFKRADQNDTHPQFGPTGAKREVVGGGSVVKTYPFHQGVIEAYQGVQNEADKLNAAQKSPAAQVKPAAKPVSSTEHYDASDINHRILAERYRNGSRRLFREDYDDAIAYAKAQHPKSEEEFYQKADSFLWDRAKENMYEAFYDEGHYDDDRDEDRDEDRDNEEE